MISRANDPIEYQREIQRADAMDAIEGYVDQINVQLAKLNKLDDLDFEFVSVSRILQMARYCV